LPTLKEASRKEAQQEVSRFVRWCGRDRKLADITPVEVGNYAEEFAGSITVDIKRLIPVRKFLRFLHNNALTDKDLSSHLKASRNNKRRPRAGTSQGPKTIQKTYLTAEGYAKLQNELNDLQEELPKVRNDIQRAMADKDFRENAPLDAAKERQGMIMARIRDLESTLAEAVVEEKQKERLSTRKVGRSSRVTLRDTSTDREVCYTLVDPRETDPAAGKISFSSPIGEALLDKSAGQKITINVPNGTLRFRIEKVES
jgi:transcription elongation factor GreA